MFKIIFKRFNLMINCSSINWGLHLRPLKSIIESQKSIFLRPQKSQFQFSKELKYQYQYLFN